MKVSFGVSRDEKTLSFDGTSVFSTFAFWLFEFDWAEVLFELTSAFLLVETFSLQAASNKEIVSKIKETEEEQDAYIEALLYYQKKLTEVKKDYKLLNEKVENFISQFDKDGDE